MQVVSVKAAPGRIARAAPDGQFISHDVYVTVERTPYVTRLIEHWGDLIQEPKQAVEPIKPAAKPATKEVS